MIVFLVPPPSDPAATAPVRDRREREPRLSVRLGGSSYRTRDWSLTGLMLDAVPERVIAGLPNAPEPISLLLEPVQAGLPAVSVTATLARRGDGWVGLQFSRLNRDVMDYFALALLLHEAGGGGAPLPASLLPDQRHELDTEQRDRRSRTIHSLMLDVQRVAGLEIGAAIQAKLARIVDAAPLDEV
ncbi:MAG: hypothetical protein SF002_14095, partial [Alphaproteobacteria bacterium]|nr:hypothetical protein [Alphaproteobacteria bacterium]